MRDLTAIEQAGDPPMRNGKVKLKLFDGSFTKPSGVATLKVHRNDNVVELYFQIGDTPNKPLLSAETCEKLGLLKVTTPESVNSVTHATVKSANPVQIPLTEDTILTELKDVFEGLGHIGDANTFVLDSKHTPVQRTRGGKERSQRENSRAGEEGDHNKGNRANRMDQFNGGRSQTREDQNMHGSRRLKSSPQKTKVPNANTG